MYRVPDKLQHSVHTANRSAHPVECGLQVGAVFMSGRLRTGRTELGSSRITADSGRFVSPLFLSVCLSVRRRRSSPVRLARGPDGSDEARQIFACRRLIVGASLCVIDHVTTPPSGAQEVNKRPICGWRWIQRSLDANTTRLYYVKQLVCSPARRSCSGYSNHSRSSKTKLEISLSCSSSSTQSIPAWLGSRPAV